MIIVILIPLPKPLFNVPYSTVLKSSEGFILSASIASDEQWRFPESDSIPEKFVESIRLYEDEYFYYHIGINPFSIIRALYQNLVTGKIVSGGSTLTMQTVRMMYGNKKRTYFQKFLELFVSLKLEFLYSKKEILKLYASHAPFGGNIVGLNAASWRYFGRSPHMLSWAEVASLAVLPNNPSGVYPGKNTSIFLKKRNKLLEKLYKHNFFTEIDLKIAKMEPLPGKIISLPNYSPHLLNRAQTDGHRGKEIKSSIQYSLQKSVNEKLNRYAKRLRANHINNSAALVIEIKTGRALAYVGNVDSEGENGQHVDIISSQRSPGSLLKPFLYAMSINDGELLPQQLLQDIPLFYRGFSPKNFDKKFRGVVNADNALASSLNVPFVTLLKKYGVEKFFHKLKYMGMNSLSKTPEHYGLSLILGGAETSLWEITSIYASIAREYFKIGKHFYFPNSYDLENKKWVGRTISNFETVSLGHTFRAMQRLRRPIEEAGWKSFGSSRPIAWKTGTSVGFRDAWAIGLNNKYVVGVWVGNADGEGRPGLTGVSSASPLMFDIFKLLDGDVEFNDEFGIEVSVCKKSGLRATELCREIKRTFLPKGALNGNTCTYHKMIHLTKDSLYRVNSSCYKVKDMRSIPYFILPPVNAWYYKKTHSDYNEPPRFLNSCEEIKPKSIMDMVYPNQKTKVYIPKEQNGERGKVIFEAVHRQNNATIFWHLDNVYIGSTYEEHQMEIDASIGYHKLTLVDQEGNELRQVFKVIN